MGAARTPDGLESGGRDSPDVGGAKEIVVVGPTGVGGGGDGAARPLAGGLSGDMVFEGGRVGAARPLGGVGVPSFAVEEESRGFEIQSSPLIGSDALVSFDSDATGGVGEAVTGG
ncbi:hypothetical protein HG531_007348 [Fusarium graminearum]|nr:hypothetical protein HG531_007348 [Fusarium graminearum]